MKGGIVKEEIGKEVSKEEKGEIKRGDGREWKKVGRKVESPRKKEREEEGQIKKNRIWRE